jgi:hypothetical protein
MRNDVLNLLKAQKESTDKDIEACELMMVECREDPEACTSLLALQAKYEAVADELDTQIQKLK